jgi:hypothetical protein
MRFRELDRKPGDFPAFADNCAARDALQWLKACKIREARSA